MVTTRRPRRRGFTLIELMVVMAVIALLTTIALPHYFKHVDTAKERVLRANLETARDAIDKFYADRNQYPASLAELVTQRYLKTLPMDPITDRADSWKLLTAPGGEPGVYDLHSGAPGKSMDGTPYADW
ncbi:type IV pilin protein [Ralstonia solanacearum]|uniref:type IV pilin protein n=1 Tax=Ralstonia solanacearum TaxID=305 RepID=UPI001E5D16D8|nr:prepilin-type N-terminal cleavage/methylation domain-containing protein [Ralstonia solanacearum]